MAETLTLELPARAAGLQQALARIEGWCAAQGLPRDLALRLLVVVEELFTNSVKYGYGAECDRPVRLALAPAGAGVELAYEDEAPPFDPTAWRGALPESAPLCSFRVITTLDPETRAPRVSRCAIRIGRAGAVNAALLAASIVGARHPEHREAVRRYRDAQTAAVLAHPDPRPDSPATPPGTPRA